jgi:hypothetical protein
LGGIGRSEQTFNATGKNIFDLFIKKKKPNFY